ncbi:MAG: peptidoglycan DD-metalloendopeptidase family protein [Bacteroidales bacterium]|nr:peptidoglycan DD-metalloendopeptidase family protein [Bacteroidales bacterium]
MMKRILIAILTLLVLLSPAQAQDIDRHKELKKKIEQEISFIDNQLKSLNTKQKATRENLTLIQKKASDRKAVISQLDVQIRDAEQKIEAKNAEIAKLQGEIDTLGAYYSRLVYNAYKNRDTKAWFMYVLASENIGQGYRRLSYIKNLSVTVNEQAEKIRIKREELESEKKLLEGMMAQALKAKNERQREYKTLVAEEKETQGIIKEISRNQGKYRKELAAKRKEVEKLNREIQQMVQKSVAADKKKNLPVDTKLSGSFEQNKGKLGWPVARGVITEQFGVHFHPVYKNIKLPENNGITIRTDKNAEVHCVFEGTVKQIVMMQGYGQCVLVQHGAYYTFYCKLRKVTVKSGQKVATGQVLGYLEGDGKASSIHFQIWKGTQKQNPEAWLRPN